MNKFKIVLYVFLCSVLLSACYHEDDIIPSEKTMVLRFDFPQGNNSWDEDLAKINEEFGVCMIYKDIEEGDYNRSWTGGGVFAAEFHGQDLNDEQAQFYTNFFKNHVFNYLNAEITQKVLPPYYYMVYDYHALYSFGTMQLKSEMSFYTDNLDFWVTCLEGDVNPLTFAQLVRPKTAEDYLMCRGVILKEIFEKAIEVGNIVVPEEFNTGIDYQTEITYKVGYENDDNYYVKRGFPGIMYTTFNFSDLQSVTKINPQTNFLQYINLGMRYTKEEYEALRPSSKYPLVHEKRQFVIDYMKRVHNIDLVAIVRGPEL